MKDSTGSAADGRSASWRTLPSTMSWQFPDASAKWNIRGIPALIAFRKGREVTRAAGARPAQAIADFARQAMGRQG